MTSPIDQLAEYRASIDNLDAILLHTLAERFKVTQAVGRLKAENDMPPADKDREARQIARLRALADEFEEDRYRPNPLLKKMARENQTFF